MNEIAEKLITERVALLFEQIVRKRGHDSPPFLPEEYAYLLRVKKIIKEDLGEKTSGMLYTLHDGQVITINKNQNQARQNFSCAHEIGHILFNELNLTKHINIIEHRTFNPMAQSKIRSIAIEHLCDIAATEILMPKSIFKKYLSYFELSINAIERLADIFKVSIQAAALRTSEVSTESCFVLKWQKRRNKTNSLYLSWHKRKIINENSYIPKTTKVNPPSTLHKAFEQNITLMSYKKFNIGSNVKRILMESKGFGYDENRFVLSLAFPER